MKKVRDKAIILAVFSMLFYISFASHAQESDLNKLRLGMQLQKVQNDYGFGLNVLSPAFLGKFRMKNSYNRNFLSHLDREGLSTLTPYSSFNFGTRYQFGILNNVNMYIEAGSQMLISPGSISSEKLNFGGYGLVGVEYFLSENANRNLSVFIELGGTGNNSRADKLLTKPKIATGSTLSVGFQYSIKMNK